jgi:hypothetical protein
MDRLTKDTAQAIERIHSAWIDLEVAGEARNLLAFCAEDIRGNLDVDDFNDCDSTDKDHNAPLRSARKCLNVFTGNAKSKPAMRQARMQAGAL